MRTNPLAGVQLDIVNPSQEIDFEHNRRLLNRYRFIEYEGLRILAAWLPATAKMEWKLALGRFLWEDAQHVQHLYKRLFEIQIPAFRPPEDDALEFLMAEALHAPTEQDLFAGLFRVVKPALLDAYRWHSEQTFANPDAPTLYAFKHIMLDKEAQLAWAREALADYPVGAWEHYLTALLASSGGVTGREPRTDVSPKPLERKRFATPKEAARDERFSLKRTAEGSTPQKEARLLDFEHYSQEMLAAETVALIIYQSPDMPWGFVYDSARHCYDETRHCRLGIEWLELHGLDYTQVPQNTLIYAWRSQYDPATQYALLTMGNEAHVFPYRHKQIEVYREMGDKLSTEFISYDMADERQHVAFGHKWLPVLMEKQGIDKPVAQFIEETVALWNKEYVSGELPLHTKLPTKGSG